MGNREETTGVDYEQPYLQIPAPSQELYEKYLQEKENEKRIEEEDKESVIVIDMS
jgi:hypothetical protein